MKYRRKKLTTVLIVLAAAFATVLAGVVVVVIYVSHVMLDMERRSHATVVLGWVVAAYIDESGEWPRNWDDLEDIKGIHSGPVEWPKDDEYVKDNVAIDFDVTVDEVAVLDYDDIMCIRPLGNAYSFYRHHGFVPLLRAAREAVAGERPKQLPGAETGAGGQKRCRIPLIHNRWADSIPKRNTGQDKRGIAGPAVD